MATSRDMRSVLTDAVTCPICLQLFNSPKSLPCLHTFCLKCIEANCGDTEPGDEVACPVCRQKFNIPESGVAGLVSNFFIAGLVEARKTASDVTVQVPCEVCLLECDSDDDNAAVSTMFCVDCNQKLCEQCSRPHRRWKGGPHKVVPITGSGLEADLIQSQGGKCDKHMNDDVRLYCFDCKKNICLMCFAEEHKQHDTKNVNAVADDCVKQIDTDLEAVKEQEDGARDETSCLDEETRLFLASVEGVWLKIVQRAEWLKQLIDAQANELMLEVQSLKTETCKEIESRKEDIELKLLAFETFSVYCSELKAKGKPCDITRAASDIHTRAVQLLQNGVMPDYHVPIVTFTAMNIRELVDDGHNIIGNITTDTTTDSSQTSSPISFILRGEKTLQQQLAQSVETERSLREQIEEYSSQLADNDKMWTQKVNDLEVQIRLLNEQGVWKDSSNYGESQQTKSALSEHFAQFPSSGDFLELEVENSEKAVNNLEKRLQKLREIENDLRVKLVNSEKSVNGLEKQCDVLPPVSESDLQSKLESAEMSVKTLERECETLKENEAVLRARLETSDKARTKLEWDVDQLRRSDRETRAKLEKSEYGVRSLHEQLEQLRKSENSLKEELKSAAQKEKELHEQLQHLSGSEHLLKEYLQRDVRVVHALPEVEPVWGVTSLDDELYVLRNKSKDQVEVYKAATTRTTASYSLGLLRQLSVPGLVKPVDMTSCKHYRCLYIADYGNRCVRRVELNGKVADWPVNNEPSSLSLTSQFTVLVTCCGAGKLLEFTTEGKQLREINLQADIVHPQHAIQLSNGQFVVCHGYSGDPIHRVCIVDAGGRVTQSYDGLPGSATVGQLKSPIHLALDQDGFVFVADSEYRRVFLLSPTLSYVREIVTSDELKGKPERLLVDVDRRRLYVADSNTYCFSSMGRVVLVQM